jgi:hypothetical protein
MIRFLLIGVPLIHLGWATLMAFTRPPTASADDPDMYHALYRLNRWRR